MQTDLHRLFVRRNPNQDFFSLNITESNNNKESKKKSGKKNMEDLNNDANMNIDQDCAICMDMSRNSVLRPCNHMITCFNCSMLLMNRSDSCPVCREKIEDVIKIFMS